MKKVIGYSICILFTLLQIAMIVGLRILDSLSLKKAGVNHHLMVRKYFYEHWIFNDLNKYVMCFVLIAIMIAIIIILKKSFHKGHWYQKWVYLCNMLLCVVLIWQLWSESFHQKLSYPYIIMGTGVILLLELVEVFVVKKLICN